MANGEVAIALEKMEEKAEATPVADNSKEKVASSHSKPEATVEISVMKDEHGSSKKWSPKEEEAHDPPQGCFLQKWKKIFVASCLFAVLLDPLFLYVPMMRDEIKCLLYDRNLKIAALLLRSLTDLFYILDIIFQIYASPNYSDVMDLYRRIRLSCSKIRFWRKYFVPTIAKTILGSYNILIDIMAILPLPQVAIFIFFSKMRDLRSLSTKRMAIMNFFVLLQYVPRVLCIYLSCKELKRTPKGGTGETAIWVKGVLNFFMYIIASHVLGAIWYFFAIQRMAICWHDACQKENGCDTSTFGCHEHQTFRNIRFLNDLCPISPVNTTLFDFGIYSTILQSGIPGSTNYFVKFSNCFWWGLRNLSSLGSNLEPSIDGWENLFAAFISIIGLLLFLYLIGNLQTYMQLNTARREDHRHKVKVKRKMEKKDKETELWLSEKGIPKNLINDIKPHIMDKVRQEVEEDGDADLDYIFSILPPNLQIHIKKYMQIKEIDRKVESWISGHCIPLSRKQKIMEEIQRELVENSDFDVVMKIHSILPHQEIKSCRPLSRLRKVPLLKDMDEGVLVEISEKLHLEKYTPGQIIIKKDETLQMMLFIVDGHVNIEKTDASLLEDLGPGNFYGQELLVSPLWTSDAKPINESVRAIDDVQALVLSVTDMATLGFSSRRSINELRMVVNILQKVPKLETMDKQVLKAMSHQLSSVSYKHEDCIVRENQPVGMMFFVTRGEVTKNENPPEANFIGEELLDWVRDESFPTILPLSTCTVKVVSDDAEVLILKAKSLKSVVSRFTLPFSNFASPSDVRLTWLKKVEIFQQMEEQVLEAISKCLKPMNFNVAKRHILQEKKPLKMMFFVMRGVVSIESDSAMDVNVKKTCEIGSFYGEELVQWVTTWVSHKPFPAKLPLSPCSALCGVLGGSVEILALKADDLKSVVSDQFRSKFSTETALPTESDQPREPLTILKNVESVKTMDEEVLKEICDHLTKKTYKDEYIIRKDKRMEMMFFIVGGVVSVTNESSKHYRREGERPSHSGDELLQHWMQSKSTKANVPAEFPPSPFSFWAIGEVEVLILKAEDLAKVQLRDRIGS